MPQDDDLPMELLTPMAIAAQAVVTYTSEIAVSITFIDVEQGVFKYTVILNKNKRILLLYVDLNTSKGSIHEAKQPTVSFEFEQNPQVRMFVDPPK